MNKEASPTPRLPRNVWVVTLTSFLNDISSEMLFNLVPLFLFNVLGVGTSVIGFIEGVAESTASLVKLGSGWLSDRLRVRKGLAVLGYLQSAIAKPLLYFATSWGWVFVVRIADRVGKGLRTAPRDALVADSVDEENRGLAYGLHRAGDTAGALLGIVISLGVLYVLQREVSSLNRETFQIVVLLSVVPSTLAVVVMALGAKETRARHSEDLVAPLPRRTLNQPFYLFIAIMVLFTLGNSADAFLILRASSVGLSAMGILGMLITFNLVYSLVAAPAGAFSDRIGRKRLLIGGWAFYALVYLGFAKVTAGWQAWLLMAAYGLYYGFTEGVAKAFIVDLAPEASRGTAFGIFHAAVGLTALPASLIAGVLWQGVGRWEGLGPSAPFLFGAGAALTAALLLLMHPAERKQHG